MRILLVDTLRDGSKRIVRLCNKLNQLGFNVDALHTRNMELQSPTNKNRFFSLELYKFLVDIPFLKNFMIKHFLNRLLVHIGKKYDIIDIQGLFHKTAGNLAETLHNDGKKIKIHIWGSDFYRAKEDSLEWKLSAFEAADLIQIATERVKTDFLFKLPQFESKIVVCPFGNQHLDDLNNLYKHPEKQDLSFLKGNFKNKIVITCGYNATVQQQHLIMIEAINKLPQKIQDKLFVIFPMTYIQRGNYINKIKSALSETKINYEVITDYMTEEQVLSTRIISDIAINIQTTDVWASSLQEHIFCGGILIAGDWLPYSVYEDNDIFYIKTSTDNLTKNIIYAINNIEELKKKCSQNGEKLYKLNSWNIVYPKWNKIYKSLFNS